MKDKRFRPYEPDQSFLLPPNLNDWLPEGHRASFVRDVVAGLDLSAIYDAYAPGSKGGRPPEGITSSRKIERGTYESIPFRVLSANQHPDHDTICEFRKRHLAALSDLFVQVLELCRKAGLVKLGHVSLDARWSGPSAGRTCRGTKVDAGSQVIVAADVTQEANAKYLEDEGVDAYVATAKHKHGRPPPSPRGRIPKDATVKERMARKLRTKKGRETYAERKSSVEPVFPKGRALRGGQIKEARGFRRFLLRGLDAVRAEWRLVCLTHNLLKLFRTVALATAT